MFLININFQKPNLPDRIPDIQIDIPVCLARATRIEPFNENIKNLSNTFDPTFGIVILPDKKVTKSTLYKDIHLKMTSSHSVNQKQLDQVKKIIDDVPQIFLDLRPWNIYFITAGDLTNPHEREHASAAPAFTSGPHMYVLPTAFEANYTYLRYLLFHEWMHIIQYYKTYSELSENQLQLYEGTRIFQVKMFAPFFTDYARSVGWTNPEYPTRTLATDADSQKQSDYGLTHPVEDQAETASLFLTHQEHLLSAKRIAWMEQFLGCK